jgi:iron(III) transport system substrate-binding protein
MSLSVERLANPLPRRAALRLLGLGAAAGLLAACGGSQPSPTAAPAAKPTEAPKPAADAKPAASPAAGAAPAAAPAGSPAAAAPAVKVAASPVASGPTVYPANYTEIVEASKKEGGRLNSYSTISKANWAPVMEGFKKKYDWIEIDAPDLDSATIFERYYTEVAGNVRSADMIVTSSPESWPEFAKRGEIEVYKSPEDDKVPAWSKQAPGVYTVSADPFFFIYNKKLLPNPPKGIAELADMATKEAGKFTPGRIVTYEPNNASGFASHWFFAQKVGQEKALEMYSAIGKTRPKLESGGGRMVDATLAGETLVGYFVSATTVFPKFPAAQEILGYSMIADGTPTLVRSMAVTKKAQAPNSAKLLLDFLLSPEGQIALAAGGLTAYRPDVAEQSKLHLSKLAAEAGGEQNLLFATWDPALQDEAKREGFRAKLATALGR